MKISTASTHPTFSVQMRGTYRTMNLKMISIIYRIYTSKRFPKLLSKEQVCMKDIEVKLDIDPSICPTRQPQRPFQDLIFMVSFSKLDLFKAFH